MLNLKKTAVAVLALTSSAVFAGTMGPVCTPGNVTVPCESTAWDVGIYALYMQPVYDANLGYNAVTANVNFALPRVDVDFHDSSLDWGWGFKLEGSYHFNTGNDININWSHLDTTTQNQLTQGIVNINGFNILDNFTTNTKWDAVNGEFGQHIDVSDAYKVRMHAGVQYARINSDFAHQFNAVAATFLADTEFNGFGPRAGMDTSYMMGNGFSLYGNAATALLIGTSKFTDALVVNGNTILTVNGSKTAMVPMLEGKLGAKYNMAMAQGDLILDAGWLWTNYFQANHVAPVVESNFAVDGPVFGVKWIGRV